MTNDEIVANLGPLKPLAGIWEGDKGLDVAPADDRGIEKNPFRERITFDPITAVNHEQTLYGLRYNVAVFRLSDGQQFHEEIGYWHWDPKAKQVYRTFLIPRGMTTFAGGSAEPTAREFTLVAEVGSPTFGICSNPFLNREFRTIRFETTVKIGDGEWSYSQDTQMLMPGRPDLFHHTDANTLRRAK